MNPTRKACLELAAQLWRDQPSLGMLETANEVRVGVRGRRDLPLKELPGVETIRKWLSDAIAAGEMSGPKDDSRRGQTSRSRRQGQ